MLLIAILICILVVGGILKFSGWPLLVFGFVMLNPMTALLPQSQALFGVIDANHILAIAVIGAKYLGNYKKESFRSLNKQRKRAIYLMLIFYYLYNYIGEIKGELISSTGFGFLPKRLTKDFLIVWALILIIKKMDNRKVYAAIDKAIVLGGIVIGISIYFADPIRSITMLGTGMNIGGRQSGFLALNPNAAGAYCAMVIGYCLSKIEFSKKDYKIYYICIATSFIGVLGTASRTAFLASLFLFAIFVIRNKISIKKLIIPSLIIVSIFIILYSKAGEVLDERLEEVTMGLTSLDHRYEVWQIYLEDIYAKPYYMLIGNTEKAPTVYGHHNYYLALTWSMGIIFLLLYLSLIVKIIKYKMDKINLLNFPVIYSVGAYLFTSITAGNPPNQTLILIIALSTGIVQDKKQRFDKKIFVLSK